MQTDRTLKQPPRASFILDIKRGLGGQTALPRSDGLISVLSLDPQDPAAAALADRIFCLRRGLVDLLPSRTVPYGSVRSWSNDVATCRARAQTRTVDRCASRLGLRHRLAFDLHVRRPGRGRQRGRPDAPAEDLVRIWGSMASGGAASVSPAAKSVHAGARRSPSPRHVRCGRPRT